MTGRTGLAVAIAASVLGAVVLVGAALAWAGALPALGALAPESSVSIAPADAPTAHLATAVTPGTDGGADLEVRFRVDATRWAIDDFRIELPAGVRIAAAPDGWACPSDDGGGSCTPASPTSQLAVFALVADEGSVAGRYAVRVGAVAGAVTVAGNSTGELAAAR